MSDVKIQNIRVIETGPRGDINLVCLKIETNQPGLYGLGCATFTQRYSAVVTVIEEFLKPLVLGRSVDSINDIFQTCTSDSYWRNGPVLNNALSGIDEALWDIKGKMANMPVYDLLGGLTPALRVAHFCETYGIRTAWHGPFDLTPVGLAAQIHLDLASPNFGIQEYCTLTDLEREIFPGAPTFENGYLYVSGKPGFGVDIDEEKAKKYACRYQDNRWLRARLPDGTSVRA